MCFIRNVPALMRFWIRTEIYFSRGNLFQWPVSKLMFAAAADRGIETFRGAETVGVRDVL
jgi:hypothetical protein